MDIRPDLRSAEVLQLLFNASSPQCRIDNNHAHDADMYERVTSTLVC
jgi:hypothetical protein